MPMRVQYTLQGFLPAEPLSTEAAPGAESPFLSRLKYMPAARGLSWKSLLQLEDEPVDPAGIEAPPTPAGLEIRDATTERRMWMQMLDRLSTMSAGDVASNADDRAIQRMLALLLKFQQSGDSIAARALAEKEE